MLKRARFFNLWLLIRGFVACCGGILLIVEEFMLRNKTQKRVLALNRELPPRNEQFLIDFEQLQSQFPVS